MSSEVPIVKFIAHTRLPILFNYLLSKEDDPIIWIFSLAFAAVGCVNELGVHF